MLTPAMTLVRLFAWSFAVSGFTGVSYSFRPWHQLLQIIVFILWQLLKNIDKIFEWIQTVCFCGLYQAEYRCCCFCSRRGLTEQEILPREHKGLDAPFGSIVAARQPAVNQKCVQCVLPVLTLNDPITENSLDDMIRVKASDPLEIFSQNRV